MSKSTRSVGELLTCLEAEGLIAQQDLMRITDHFGKPEEGAKDPLYIRILSGIGAWVAAFFLMWFLILAHALETRVVSTIFGMVFLAGGIGITRASKTTFLSQLSLALVFAGNALIVFGVTSAFRIPDISGLVITHAIVCAVVYPLFPNSIYRFAAPSALAVLLTAWIIHEKIFVLVHFLIAAETLFAGWLLLLKKRRESLTPLVYSAAAMLPGTLLFMNLTQVNAWRIDFRIPLWPSSIVLALGLIYLYFHLAGGLKVFREPLLGLAVVSTILLGIFTTPGILVAIGLLILGYAFDDRILIGFSYLFLVCFLVLFYYTLNIDLVHKSWVIAGSGVVLLVVRWLAGRFKTEEINA
jgi:hypothetical protein